MLEELHFKRDHLVSTDAAVLGIPRSKWCSLSPGSSVDDAQALMRDHKFDVVPITRGPNVRAYFATKAWNDFSEVEHRPLGRQDVLDFRTPVRVVIQEFARHDRPYFFLVNGVEVVGLLSIAHLNSRTAKTYLYALVAELEHLIGRFVESKMSAEACVAALRRGGVDVALNEVLTGYEASVRAGTDSRLAEFLYLRHLLTLALAAGLHVELVSSGWVVRDSFASESSAAVGCLIADLAERKSDCGSLGSPRSQDRVAQVPIGDRLDSGKCRRDPLRALRFHH